MRTVKRIAILYLAGCLALLWGVWLWIRLDMGSNYDKMITGVENPAYAMPLLAWLSLGGFTGLCVVTIRDLLREEEERGGESR